MTAPAICVCSAEKEKKLFVGAQDRSVRIYHGITFELLQMVVDMTPSQPDDHLSAFLYVNATGKLYTAGNLITVWVMERYRGGMSHHDSSLDDLCTVLYNRTYKTVLFVSRGGIVSIHNIEDGSDSNRFIIPPPASEAIGNQTIHVSGMKTSINLGVTGSIKDTQDSGIGQHVIMQACLDSTDKRLIVLTSSFTVQFWDFTRGAILFEVVPQVPTSIVHLTHRGNDHKAAYAVSSMNHFSISSDEEGLRKFLILGANSGFVGCLMETAGFIDDEPSFSLVRSEEVVASSTTRVGGKLAKVLFTQQLDKHLIVAGYANGALTLWDMDRGSIEFEFEVKATGIVLGCIQKSNSRGVKVDIRLSKAQQQEEERRRESENAHKVSHLSSLVSALSTMGVLHEMVEEKKKLEAEMVAAKEREEMLALKKKEALETEDERQRQRLEIIKAHHDAALRKSAVPSLCLDIKRSFRPRLLGRVHQHRVDMEIHGHENDLLVNKGQVTRSLVINTSTSSNTNSPPRRLMVKFHENERSKSKIDDCDDSSESNEGAVIGASSESREPNMGVLVQEKEAVNVTEGETYDEGSSTSGKENLRILLADDSLVSLKIMSSALTNHGYDVTATTSGEEAITFLNNQSFSLIIIDILLSADAHGKGVPTFRHILNDSLISIPMIITTSAERSPGEDNIEGEVP